MQFRIIKLTNNDDPKEFTLEITRMRDTPTHWNHSSRLGLKRPTSLHRLESQSSPPVGERKVKKKSVCFFF